MGFKIILCTKEVCVDMPEDRNLRFFEACKRADLYKARNKKAVFSVVNEETGDLAYQV